MNVFRGDLDRLSEVLRVSAAAGDGASFRRAAHSLAGAAGAVGAQALEQACRLAMTRADIGAAQMPGVAADIAALCQGALAELAAFAGGLDRA
nr:Hpt domain-containing protein [Limobrevibacterium gyesilva]